MQVVAEVVEAALEVMV
jgi:hypothetical protein